MTAFLLNKMKTFYPIFYQVNAVIARHETVIARHEAVIARYETVIARHEAICPIYADFC